MNIKHMIWTNEFDPKYENDYRQSVAEREGKPVSEVTDDEMWSEFHHLTDLYYGDERTGGEGTPPLHGQRQGSFALSHH